LFKEFFPYCCKIIISITGYLQIEPVKSGRKAYVDSQQLQLLDELHEHISKGGVTSDFLKQQQTSNTENSSALVLDSPGQMTGLQPSALVAMVSAIVHRLLPHQPLDYLQALESAYEKGWLLSTSELADLLKLSPKTIASYGLSFEDAGFVFTRCGKRKKGEIAWRVEKAEDFDLPNSSYHLGIKSAFSEDNDPN
jgi:hypothetical protein